MTGTTVDPLFPDFEHRRVTVGDVTINLVTGGDGPPLLLLHGYPQTHAMWHRVAPRLAGHFTVVACDLRGYGDSSKPPGAPAHETYCKRSTALDQVRVMEALGFERFHVAGHDRGGRVAHRMALDHRERVRRLAVLDIVPTLRLFRSTDQAFATGYYHWFFLIQPGGLPERLIGADPDYYLREKLGQWSGRSASFAPEAMAEYLRCFRDPATIHASCEDYRAAASLDLEHDEADLDRPITCPVLALWGEQGLMHRIHDVLGTWKERAVQVEGRALPSGHFLAEECPAETADALLAFFSEDRGT